MRKLLNQKIVLMCMFLIAISAVSAFGQETLCFTQRVTDASSFNIYTGRDDANNPIVWTHNIPAGLIDSVVRVGIYIEAYDVDYPANDEYDRVYFNGVDLGLLEGANNSWITVEKTVPVSALREGVNEIRVLVDEDPTGDNWKVTIRACELRFYCSSASQDFSMGFDKTSAEITQGESASALITMVGLNGFSSNVDLSTSALPPGITAVFTPDPVSVTPSGTATLKFTTTDEAVTGSHVIKINGTSGSVENSKDFILKVNRKAQPDFTITSDKTELNLSPLKESVFTINLNAVDGFSDTVNLSVTGLPAGVSGTLSSSSLTPPGQVTLTMKADKSAVKGSYTFKVEAAGGSKSHDLNLKVNITESDFDLEIEADKTEGPAPLTVNFKALVENISDTKDLTYRWDFGDGTTSAEETFSHTYSEPGNYKVTLEVEKDGVKKSADCTIEVYSFEGRLIKEFEPTAASAGDEVTFGLLFENSTEKDFQNVVIEDTLSEDLEFISDTAPVQAVKNGNKYTWTFPVLKKSDRIKFRVKVKIKDSVERGVIYNTAYLNHSSLDKAIESNRASLTVRNPELTVIKEVDKQSARPGDLLKYKITLNNASSIALTGIELEDTISDKLLFKSASAGSVMDSGEGKLEWKGRLDAGETKVLTLEAKVKPETLNNTLIQNQVSVKANELKEPVNSNIVSTRVLVQGIDTGQESAKIRFTHKAEIPQADIGRVLRFNATVMNYSSVAVISPVLEVHLPQGFRYVEGTTLINGQKFDDPQGGRVLRWNIAHLNPGNSITLRYQVITGSDTKRGRNINRAVIRGTANNGEPISAEASAFVSISAASFVFYSNLEGTVYLDRDGDGFYSVTDEPIAGIEVILSNGKRTVTGSDGRYRFDSLYSGEYALGVNRYSLPAKYKPSGQATQFVLLSDGLSDTVDLPVKLARDNQQNSCRFEGLVFFDKSKNRKYDDGEPRVKSFTVTLNDKTTTSGAQGRFVFKNLEPGRHQIKISYENREVTRTVNLVKGRNLIELPLRFGGVRIFMRGKK